MLTVRAKNRSLFYCPGGQAEGDESPLTALLREVREELGISLSAHDLVYLGTVTAQADARPSGTDVVMVCFACAYDASWNPGAQGEIGEVRWLSWEERYLMSAASAIAFEMVLT